MERQSLWQKLVNRLFIPAGEEDLSALKEILPFYLMVTGVMGWIYYTVLQTTPALENRWLLAAFTVLMVVHLCLYWLTIFFSASSQKIFWYIVIQGIIVFVLVLITLSDIVVMALYTSLMGNAIGMLGKKKASLAAAAYYLVLAVLSLTIVITAPQVKQMLLVLLPVAAFTIFFAYFFNRQIQARLQMQELLEELELAHQQLTEYTIRVEDLTLAGERQRMARELHDTLAQGLAGLILQLEAAAIHIEGENTARAKQIVEQAMVKARATLVDARKAIDDLRADLGEPLALQHSIRREVERFQTATMIPCELEVCLPEKLDTKLSEHILRTITEGLWNIARHAQASQAAVHVVDEGGVIEMCIEDDGVGFDPDEKVGSGGHYGLLGIRERVRLAGGKFELTSEAGSGTTLKVSLPVREEQVFNE